MKIINQTHWRTDHLKAILQRCAEMELEPSKRKRVKVTVVYSNRHDGSSGCALVGGNRCRIRIPKGAKQPVRRFVEHYRKCDNDPEYSHPDKGNLLVKYLSRFDEAESLRNIKLSFASVACHEFAHNRGMEHRQMPKQYTWADGWKDYVTWAADMPLETQTVKRKPLADVQQQRYNRVLELANQWTAKLKRAQAALKKLRAKERYYERAFAAKGVNDADSQNTESRSRAL